MSGRVQGSVEIFILAGGRSSRMGRDKARLRLGGRSLLAHVRTTGRSTGWPVRVVRRDAVPRCGPLGGVLTALQRTKARIVVFLACDAPFVNAKSIREVASTARRQTAAFFANAEGTVGFPFALRREARETVAERIKRRGFSLKELAKATRAQRLRVPKRDEWRRFNINTPGELAEARRLWRERFHKPQTRLVSRTKPVIIRA